MAQGGGLLPGESRDVVLAAGVVGRSLQGTQLPAGRPAGVRGQTEREITVRHQTFSDHFVLLSDQRSVWSAIMSEQ